MEENERLMKVETNVDHIMKDVSDIKVMLIEHIEKDSDKLTRKEAAATYANKYVEDDVKGFKVLATRFFWIVVTGMSSIIIGLVTYIAKNNELHKLIF